MKLRLQTYILMALLGGVNIFAIIHALHASYGVLALAETVKCFVVLGIVLKLNVGTTAALFDQGIGNSVRIVLMLGVSIVSLIGDSSALGFLNY